MNKFVVSLMLAVAMVFGAVTGSNAEETMVKKVDYFTLMMDKSGSMFMRDAETDLLKMYLAKEAVANVFEAVDEKYGFEEGLKTACGYKEYHSGKYTLENVKAFLKNCRRLYERRDEYDFIMPNHNGCPVSKSYLVDFIMAAEHIVDGHPDLVDTEDVQNYCRGFFKGHLRAQIGNSCINYLPEGLLPERGF